MSKKLVAAKVTINKCPTCKADHTVYCKTDVLVHSDRFEKVEYKCPVGSEGDVILVSGYGATTGIYDKIPDNVIVGRFVETN